MPYKMDDSEKRLFVVCFTIIVILALALIAALWPEVKTERQIRQEAIEAQVRAVQEKYGTTGKTVSSSSRSSSSSLSSSSSESNTVAPYAGDAKGSVEAMKEKLATRTVIVDQSYEGMVGKTDRDWINAIGAVRISGKSSFARIEVELSRNGQNTGFQGVAAYFAPLNASHHIHSEWRRARYVDATLLKACSRALSAKSTLSTLGVEKVSKTYDLAYLPTTKEDTCDLGQDQHDILGAIITHGAILGFYPTNVNAHLKITLVHDGGLIVSAPFAK
jgi:hypothetical protein